MPKRVRSNVFDVARTDRDEAEAPGPPLSELLPRVTPSTPPPTAATGTTRLPAVEVDGAVQVKEPSRPRSSAAVDRPRGVGGRSGAATGRITTTPARVPVELYIKAEPLVKGSGRPSWGQLVSWTCQTREADVIAAVLDQLRPATGLVPRGQNKQGRGTTQVTARLTLDEQQVFTATLERVNQKIAAGDVPTTGRATATAVVIAALEVAAGDPTPR